MANENIKINQIDTGQGTLVKSLLQLRHWWIYLGTKRTLLLIVMLLAGVLALAYGYFKKPVYIATTTFVLENGESGGGGLSQYMGIASMMGIDLGGAGGGGIFQGDNIIELYKSRNMIERALLHPVVGDSTQLLIDRYIQFNNYQKWFDNHQLNNITFNSYRQLLNDKKAFRLRDSIMTVAVEKINKYNLSVGKPDKKLDIIKVDVKAKDEVFAKEFNDQIVKNVNDFYVQTKTKKSLDNVNILQQKTDAVRKGMNADIYAAVAIADATPNLNPTRQVQRMAPVQKSQFSAETNKAILAELVKNLEMAKFNLRKDTPLIQVIDTPILPLKDNHIKLFWYPLVAMFGALCLMAVFLLIRESLLSKLR